MMSRCPHLTTPDAHVSPEDYQIPCQKQCERMHAAQPAAWAGGMMIEANICLGARAWRLTLI
jgi:hypothetical protein